LSNRSNEQKQGVFPPLPEHPPLPIQKGWKRWNKNLCL
jgi:hypothetical protein